MVSRCLNNQSAKLLVYGLGRIAMSAALLTLVVEATLHNRGLFLYGYRRSQCDLERFCGYRKGPLDDRSCRISLNRSCIRSDERSLRALEQCPHRGVARGVLQPEKGG